MVTKFLVISILALSMAAVSSVGASAAASGSYGPDPADAIAEKITALTSAHDPESVMPLPADGRSASGAQTAAMPRGDGSIDANASESESGELSSNASEVRFKKDLSQRKIEALKAQEYMERSAAFIGERLERLSGN